MSELGKNLKELVLKGIDAIGDTASNLAACTRQKMNVISIQNRKNEILEAFGNKAYEAWKNGTVFPDCPCSFCDPAANQSSGVGFPPQGR